ncbi:hypothetical protein HDU98_010544, partial [Podochytrium sp. JEL0797]
MTNPWQEDDVSTQSRGNPFAVANSVPYNPFNPFAAPPNLPNNTNNNNPFASIPPQQHQSLANPFADFTPTAPALPPRRPNPPPVAHMDSAPHGNAAPTQQQQQQPPEIPPHPHANSSDLPPPYTSPAESPDQPHRVVTAVGVPPRVASVVELDEAFAHTLALQDYDEEERSGENHFGAGSSSVNLLNGESSTSGAVVNGSGSGGGGGRARRGSGQPRKPSQVDADEAMARALALHEHLDGVFGGDAVTTRMKVQRGAGFDLPALDVSEERGAVAEDGCDAALARILQEEEDAAFAEQIAKDEQQQQIPPRMRPRSRQSSFQSNTNRYSLPPALNGSPSSGNFPGSFPSESQQLMNPRLLSRKSISSFRSPVGLASPALSGGGGVMSPRLVAAPAGRPGVVPEGGFPREMEGVGMTRFMGDAADCVKDLDVCFWGGQCVTVLAEGGGVLFYVNLVGALGGEGVNGKWEVVMQRRDADGESVYLVQENVKGKSFHIVDPHSVKAVTCTRNKQQHLVFSTITGTEKLVWMDGDMKVVSSSSSGSGFLGGLLSRRDSRGSMHGGTDADLCAYVVREERDDLSDTPLFPALGVSLDSGYSTHFGGASFAPFAASAPLFAPLGAQPSSAAFAAAQKNATSKLPKSDHPRRASDADFSPLVFAMDDLNVLSPPNQVHHAFPIQNIPHSNTQSKPLFLMNLFGPVNANIPTTRNNSTNMSGSGFLDEETVHQFINMDDPDTLSDLMTPQVTVTAPPASHGDPAVPPPPPTYPLAPHAHALHAQRFAAAATAAASSPPMHSQNVYSASAPVRVFSFSSLQQHQQLEYRKQGFADDYYDEEEDADGDNVMYPSSVASSVFSTLLMEAMERNSERPASPPLDLGEEVKEGAAGSAGGVDWRERRRVVPSFEKGMYSLDARGRSLIAVAADRQDSGLEGVDRYGDDGDDGDEYEDYESMDSEESLMGMQMDEDEDEVKVQQEWTGGGGASSSTAGHMYSAHGASASVAVPMNLASGSGVFRRQSIDLEAKYQSLLKKQEKEREKETQRQQQLVKEREARDAAAASAAVAAAAEAASVAAEQARQQQLYEQQQHQQQQQFRQSNLHQQHPDTSSSPADSSSNSDFEDAFHDQESDSDLDSSFSSSPPTPTMDEDWKPSSSLSHTTSASIPLSSSAPHHLSSRSHHKNPQHHGSGSRTKVSSSPQSNSLHKTGVGASSGSHAHHGAGGHAAAGSNRPRDFQCVVCRKWFLRRQDLRRHEVTHSKLKAFQCPLGCGTSFGRSDALSSTEVHGRETVVFLTLYTQDTDLQTPHRMSQIALEHRQSQDAHGEGAENGRGYETHSHSGYSDVVASRKPLDANAGFDATNDEAGFPRTATDSYAPSETSMHPNTTNDTYPNDTTTTSTATSPNNPTPPQHTAAHGFLSLLSVASQMDEADSLALPDPSLLANPAAAAAEIDTPHLPFRGNNHLSHHHVHLPPPFQDHSMHHMPTPPLHPQHQLQMNHHTQQLQQQNQYHGVPNHGYFMHQQQQHSHDLNPQHHMNPLGPPLLPPPHHHQQQLRRHAATSTVVAAAASAKDTRARHFLCSVCQKGFLRKQDLSRHEVTHSTVKAFSCPLGCGTTFGRSDAMS